MTGSKYPVSGLNDVMGFLPDGTKSGSVQVVQNHDILKPYSAQTIADQISYGATFKTPLGNGQTVILKDGTSNVLFTNTFGQGRSAFIPYVGDKDWSSVGGQGSVNGLFSGQFGKNGGGTPRDSYIVILTNAVLWASMLSGVVLSV